MDARQKTIEALDKLGLMEKIEDHPMVIPYGDRTGAVIEPLMTDQWFVDAPTLAKEAIRVVENGDMQFVPKNYEKTYFEWMRNIQPWCISRQLWWGHQMPIWYAEDGTIFCEETEEKAYSAAEKHFGQKVKLTRETDVLDTWFSSGLWAFSTLGWPDKSEFLDTFYPTSVLVTGFDIIFFWVARMMMMSMYAMKNVPFKKCYIHGLIRDEQGRKMSKSKNNTVDPLETIEKYGADALRFFMAASETQGRDINISDSRIAGYRNFATKLWNAARFCEMNECRTDPSFDPKNVKMELNKWIISKADDATAEVTKNLNDFRFSDAANTVYQFVWGTFCDWFIELSKPVFYGSDDKQKQETRSTAAYVLDRILVILHPFMPFITTEIWNKTANRSVKLIHAPWPKVEAKVSKQNAIDWAIDLISSVRSLRSDLNLPAGAKPHLFLKDLKADNITQTADMVKTLAHVEDVALLSGEITKDMIQGTFSSGVFLIPLKGIVDFESERARLQKEIAAVEGRIKGYEAKLSNENFVSRAPAQIVEDEKKRLSEAKEEHFKLSEAFNRIKDL